jgi:hemoglobin/transferrin/lactoferrin receptor protein
VITATRSQEAAYDTAASTALLDRDEIAGRLQPMLLQEALVEVPGVLMQKTGSGQASPYIRGHTGFQTLLLVDGVRVNNSVFRPGPNQYWGTIDALGVDRLEISKGPGGALYGSDAIGGVVQAFSASPWGYGEGVETHGRALYRFGSANSSHQGRAEASLTWEDRLGVLIGVSPKKMGDIVAGPDVGKQRETGYRELDGDAKVVYRLGEKSELRALYQHVIQEDAPRTHKTVFAVPFDGTTVGDELKRELDQSRDFAYLQYLIQEPCAFVDEARLSVSWQLMREDRERIRSDGRRDLTGFDAHTIGSFAQLTSRSSFGTFVYGYDYYHDEVDSKRTDISADGSTRTRAIQGAVGDEASYDLLGAYTQWKYPILEQLELTIGGRFTYAAAEADRVEDPVGGGVISIDDEWYDGAGSARLMWMLLDELHLYASANQGFRSPNLSDLSRFDTARTDEIQTPSPDLDPERFVSFEVGAKTRGTSWSGTAAFYYTLIWDGLIRAPTGDTIDGDQEVRVTNVGDGYVMGIEAEASVELIENLDLFGNIAWQYGKQDTFPTAAPDKEREYIDRLMPRMGLLGLRWKEPSGRFWAELSARFAARADRLSTRDQSDTQRIPPGGTASYEVLNLRGGAVITERLSVHLSVENLTNRTYRVHGSGVTSPGTNAIVSAELTF